MRSRITAATGVLALSLALAACGGGGDPLAADGPTGEADGIVVGSADFPESQLLATIYAQALNAEGIEATTHLNIGSREVYMPALLDGSITLLPEYTGATLSYLDSDAEGVTPDEVAAALETTLPEGISMLTPSEAQDTDILAVTRATADEYGLETISDLEPYAGDLVLGGPPEWETRHEGVAGLAEVYGLEFAEFRPLDVGGPLTLAALVNGQIDAADMYSTNPAIEENDLVALVDDQNLFRAQEIVPIIAEDQASDEVAAVLDAVSAALTTEDLILMNGYLADEQSLDDVAAAWLADHDLD
jgi:osmoprotectant transport system substrate-binding protein